MRVAWKILALVIAMVVLVLAIEAVVQSRREAALYVQDLRRDQRVLGRALREVAEATWRDRGAEQMRKILEAAASSEREVAVQLVDEARLEAALGETHGPVSGEPEHDLLQFERTTGDGALVTLVPLAGPDGERRALELTTPLLDQRAYLARGLRRIGVLAIVLLFATSALTLTAGVRFVGRPVAALARQAQGLAEGRFVHSNLKQRDEIGDLGQALDRTADQLANARETIETVTRQRVAAVERLRHADRLVTVGTLAAGVAHELGTPLHVIEGRAKRIVRSTDDPKLREQAEVIVGQCQAVTEIVSDLLGFARPARGERATVRLDTICRELAPVLEPLVRRHLATITLELSPTTVIASAAQLRQVLTNLIVNAAQASPEGGTISLQVVHAATAQLERPESVEGPLEDWSVIRVSDEGHGMDPQVRERIFDPFFTTKEPGDGTGLGLSIAFGIVREHGGQLVVRSKKEHGSTFEVWLPLDPPHQAGVEEA